MCWELTVDSEPGKGSVFQFTIPFALGDLRTPDEQHEQPQLHALPVLVVDDNGTNRRILEEMLRGWGMRPNSASNGVRALAVLRNAADAGQPYHLVLLDMLMPEMDGISVADMRSEEHTSELQSLMRISYAVLCLKKKQEQQPHRKNNI